MLKLRHSLSIVLTLSFLLVLPAQTAAQICIGNTADNRRLAGVTVSTGGVDLPHDMSLHMAGVKHVSGPGGLFGVAQSVYTAQYGALTGLPNAGDYNLHAYRGEGRWLFSLPVPSEVGGPGALGVCLSVGLRLSSYGYNMKQEAITSDPDLELTGWHISGAAPVTVDVGYRIPLSEAFDLVPYVSPGISPYFGGLIHETTVDSNSDDLPTGTDFFTTVGVAANHDLFRVGLTVQTGHIEYGGATRLGLEAGIRW